MFSFRKGYGKCMLDENNYNIILVNNPMEQKLKICCNSYPIILNCVTNSHFYHYGIKKKSNLKNIVPFVEC